MNIGLSYLTQIRGGEDTGAVVGVEDPAGPGDESAGATLRSLGGWIALTFGQLVAAMTAGYHTEHHADDTHADIHADSISERGRTTPNGVWIPFEPRWSGSAAMTVTSIVGSGVSKYMLMGRTMTVAISDSNLSVGGVLSTYIQLDIPGGFVVKRLSDFANAMGPCLDNAVIRAAMIRVTDPFFAPDTKQLIKIARADSANWTASVNSTQLVGQLSFEVT